jgi:hypothetical protein
MKSSKSKVQSQKSQSFRALRVSQRLMTNCYEKFFVGEGGVHGLEARATGILGLLSFPNHIGLKQPHTTKRSKG